MAFQFRCPQGHILQGELSQIGQAFQCPLCGSSFLIPPPTIEPAVTGGPVMASGFFQGPGTWSATSAPGPSFPVQGGVPGMMPQNTPLIPGGPMPAAAPIAAPQQPPAESPPSETVKPGFDLGFDPSEKAALPFDLPGGSEPAADRTPDSPLPAPSFPPASFPPPSFPAPSFPSGAAPPSDFTVPLMPAATFSPSARGQDFLQSVPPVGGEQPWAGATQPAVGDFLSSVPAVSTESVAEKSPTILHIRCPSGHLVKATSDLLGKNGRCPACKKTFELRYEDSVEFQRRTEKILRREEIETGKTWIAWAFLAAFFVFAALVALVIVFGR